MTQRFVKLGENIFHGIADAIRAKSGGISPIIPPMMPIEIGGIKNIRMQTGTVTISDDSMSLTVPTTGRVIDITGHDVPLTTGYVHSSSWNNGPTIGNPYSLGSYVRYTSSTGSTTPNGSSCSSLMVTVSNGTTVFDTTKTDRLFSAGATYCWVAYDWDGGDVSAVYNVSATDNDSVQLIIIGNGDGTYTAWLTGSGATSDFVKNAEKPWSEYVDGITDIKIGSGVTSLGDYLFDTHENVKRIAFEDSSTITHLGARAFRRCQFGGELSFPGLTDTTVSSAFAVCINLRGVTYPETVTAIDAGAFTGCLNLYYVHGLSNVTSVGSEAFEYTPKLTDIDLNPSICKSIGASACIVSSVLRNAKLSDWPNTTFGDNSIPAANFEEYVLVETRAVRLPNVQARAINADTTYKYSDTPYCIAYNGTQQMLSEGCMAASMYHIYNWLNGGQYNNILDWWNEKILSVSPNIATETSYIDIEDKIAEALGWTLRDGYPLYINSDGNTESPIAQQNIVVAKNAIASELSNGRPLSLSFKLTDGFYHTVAIIGSDATTDELFIADSTRLSGDRGWVYKIALESIASNNVYGKIRAYDF